MEKAPSQAQYIMDHFKQHPKQTLAYDDWTDALSARYRELTGKRAYHVRSIVRRLYSEGKLSKIKNGVYMYDPDAPIVPRPKKKKDRTPKPKYAVPMKSAHTKNLLASPGLRLLSDVIMDLHMLKCGIQEETPAKQYLDHIERLQAAFREFEALVELRTYTG